MMSGMRTLKKPFAKFALCKFSNRLPFVFTLLLGFLAAVRILDIAIDLPAPSAARQLSKGLDISERRQGSIARFQVSLRTTRWMQT